MHTCLVCGEFTTNKKFCSTRCYGDYLVGKPSPTKGMKLGPPSEEKRKAISQKLKGRTLSAEHIRKRSEAQRGQSRPKESIEKTRQANIGSKRSLESRQKMSESQKRRFEIESAWNKGLGTPDPYPKEFNRHLKTLIKERDGGICQICGKTEKEEIEELGRSLAVHHIDYDKTNNSFDNLKTLCIKCHGRITNMDIKINCSEGC